MNDTPHYVLTIKDSKGNDIDVGGGNIMPILGIGGDVFVCEQVVDSMYSHIEQQVRERFPDVEGIVIIREDDVNLEMYQYRKINDMWFLEF